MTGTEIATITYATEFAYHSDTVVDDPRPSLSRSAIVTMCDKSPAHARAGHPKLNPGWEYETSTAFDIGTAAHEVLLAGEATVDVLEFDDWRTKASKEQRDASRAHGRIPLLEKEWDHVEPMVASAREVADTHGMFRDGDAEQTLVWEEDGVLCRARPDWIRVGAIDDFKTARDASPEAFSRAAIDRGYDVQDAWYRRGCRAVLGFEPEFRLLAVEKRPPYVATVFRFAPDAVSLAERKITWAIGMWRECVASGVWPAYTDRECWINLEPWHEARWLNREARVAA